MEDGDPLRLPLATGTTSSPCPHILLLQSMSQQRTSPSYRLKFLHIGRLHFTACRTHMLLSPTKTCSNRHTAVDQRSHVMRVRCLQPPTPRPRCGLGDDPMPFAAAAASASDADSVDRSPSAADKGFRFLFCSNMTGGDDTLLNPRYPTQCGSASVV